MVTKSEKTAESTIVTKSAESYSKMAKGLNKLNTSRGGQYGTKGFTFEEMHAADMRMCGKTCEVLNNNGAVDLLVNGEPLQAKVGYNSGTPKFRDGYNKVVVDKGNTKLAQKASKAGYAVEESSISSAEAETLAKAMKAESAITGQATAPITSTMASSHMAGKAAAKITAKVIVPFKAGSNLYDALSGEKSVEDAIVDTVVDSAVAVGSAYAGGAVVTAATTVASAVGATIAETTIGTAVCGIATTTTTALASTAIGGATASAVGATGAFIASAVGSVATTPILPVIAGATVIGFGIKAIKSFFFL